MGPYINRCGGRSCGPTTCASCWPPTACGSTCPRARCSRLTSQRARRRGRICERPSLRVGRRRPVSGGRHCAPGDWSDTPKASPAVGRGARARYRWAAKLCFSGRLYCEAALVLFFGCSSGLAVLPVRLQGSQGSWCGFCSHVVRPLKILSLAVRLEQPRSAASAASEGRQLLDL